MVEFSRYVELAYEIAKRRDWYDRTMRGEGSRPRHNDFMSSLAAAYNQNDHDEATVEEARAFLKDAVAPP
jgi:hypothetical protein